MADPMFKGELEGVCTRVDETLTTVQPLIDEVEALPSPVKRRQLALRMNNQLQTLNNLKPKAKEDREEFARMGTSRLLKLREAIVEFSAFDIEPASTSRKSLAASPDRPNHVPRNLEVNIPTFNGEYEKYSQFKETFEVATDIVGMSIKHKFILFRDHLGPKVQPQIANIELDESNYDMVRKIIDDRYDNRAKMVEYLYAKLQAVPAAQTATISLRTMFDAVETILRALELQKEPINENPFVRGIVARKIPNQILFILSPDKTPDLKIIRTRLENYIIVQEELSVTDIMDPIQAVSIEATIPITTVTLAAPSAPTGDKPSAIPVVVSKGKEGDEAAKRQPKCLFCDAEHFTDKCTKYRTLTERTEKLGKVFCKLCLRMDHELSECTVRRPKPCFYCRKQKLHNSALCPERFGEPVASTSKAKEETTVVALLRGQSETYLIGMAEVGNPNTGEWMNARLMLDSAAGLTYASQRTTCTLRLTRSCSRTIRVESFGGGINVLTTESVTFCVRGINRVFHAETTANICEDVPSFDYERFKAEFPEFKNTQFADPGTGPVDILIGNNYLFHFLKLERTIEIATDVFMVDTVMGKMVSGAVQRVTEKRSVLIAASNTTESLKQFWDLETLGIREEDAEDKLNEDLAYEQFAANIELKDERYEVALPWRQYPPELDSNFELARGRMRSLIRKTPTELLQECQRIFDGQIQEGIIEKATNDHNRKDVHYLPYHLVFTPEKSTKVRIVYDASAKTSRAKLSLNENLLRGLNLTPHVPEILIRFRLNRVAITSDIKHAFHNVGIRESERDYLRFLWETNPAEPSTNELVTYRFKRVPFGCISSGFLLAATIRFHLNNSNDDIANLIARDLYIDDLVTGSNSHDTAVEMIRKTVAIFKKAGMHIHKWHSNAEEVLNLIDQELIEERQVTKILGLTWDTKQDTLAIPVPEEIEVSASVTKRMVLRSLAQLFDPCGLVSPVAIVARVFMQTLHKRKANWNDELDEAELKRWRSIANNLRRCDSIVFRRYLCDFNTNTLTIHVFCDASATAYAAAVYFRYEQNEGNVKTILIMAKARVAPIKLITIPRLELLAVLIGIRLLIFVRKTILAPDVRAIIWTDSTCVLDWVASRHRLPTFVQNRIHEIKQVSNSEFRHVKGTENPADLPSRGVTVDELKEADVWWHGPRWLGRSELEWPPTYVTKPCEPEPEETVAIITVKALDIVTPLNIDETKFNRLSALIKVTARWLVYVRQLAQTIKRKKPDSLILNKIKVVFPSGITAVEVARKMWIRHTQCKFFSREHSEIIAKKKPAGVIKKLQLFMDTDGIIRTQGRMSGRPSANYDSKFTILLPKASESYFAKLIIWNAHESNCHVGTQHTLMALRRRYWMLAGRQQVYAAIKACNACKRETARHYAQPIFSQLPDSRFRVDEFPFHSMGVDVAGPVYIIDRKKWILVSTCLTTRALALETLDDMTTETTMLAMRRMAARYTDPSFVLSDNAPQFLVLRQHWGATKQEPFVWKTTVEHAPWQGACYERLVALIKTTIYRTVRAQPCYTDDQLRTITAEVESIMNERPITYLGESADLTPLTPNHFLKVKIGIERSEALPLPAGASEVAQRLRLLWNSHNEILKIVRRVWREEYLQFLRERCATMNFRQQCNVHTPKVGDVVLVQERNQKRYNWPLAVIKQVQRSQDGQIRSCVVKTKGPTLIRPVQELYYLELNELDEPTPPVNAPNNQPDVIEDDDDSD